MNGNGCEYFLVKLLAIVFFFVISALLAKLVSWTGEQMEKDSFSMFNVSKIKYILYIEFIRERKMLE